MGFFVPARNRQHAGSVPHVQVEFGRWRGYWLCGYGRAECDISSPFAALHRDNAVLSDILPPVTRGGVNHVLLDLAKGVLHATMAGCDGNHSAERWSMHASGYVGCHQRIRHQRIWHLASTHLASAQVALTSGIDPGSPEVQEEP